LAAARSATASLSSLFEYLCEKNAVTHYPVKGVKRPKAETGKGKTPALGDHQARDLGKLTHAIAEAGRGSSMRPSLILWPSKAAEAGLPRTRWRAFVMQLPCKSGKLFYIFIMSF
jgi:hypothetical protein